MQVSTVKGQEIAAVLREKVAEESITRWKTGPGRKKPSSDNGEQSNPFEASSRPIPEGVDANQFSLHLPYEIHSAHSKTVQVIHPPRSLHPLVSMSLLSSTVSLPNCGLVYSSRLDPHER